jgi:4'-phosphopantetheinyl transferase
MLTAPCTTLEPAPWRFAGPWRRVATVACPADDAVHLWRIPLERQLALAALCSAEERRRAACYVFAHERDTFLTVRAALRSILGAYLRREPAAVEFRCDPSGKPALRAAPDDPPLTFNLSHTRGLALLAVAGGRTVGIDVERVRYDLAWQAIAAAHYSPPERRRLAALAPRRAAQVFYQLWTRRESCLKAGGVGLSRLAEIRNVNGCCMEFDRQRWQLWTVCARPGYAATLATGEGAIRINGYDWRAPPD